MIQVRKNRLHWTKRLNKDRKWTFCLRDTFGWSFWLLRNTNGCYIWYKTSVYRIFYMIHATSSICFQENNSSRRSIYFPPDFHPLFTLLVPRKKSLRAPKYTKSDKSDRNRWYDWQKKLKTSLLLIIHLIRVKKQQLTGEIT